MFKYRFKNQVMYFNSKIERVMKKEAKVEYGIQIVKPWSKAMYDHNEEVADVVCKLVLVLWFDALDAAELELEAEDDEFTEISELDWLSNATPDMLKIQTAITCYGFGYGYTIDSVADIIERDLYETPLYRLKEIAEDLELELEKGFIGFN